MTWPFKSLRPGAYDLIVADPPWTFAARSDKGLGKSPQAHYGCMSLAAIGALPVERLAKRDAWLLLWTCAPLLDAAFGIGAEWGFSYVSRASWAKTTVNGKRRMGPGYVVRTLSEDVLIFKRGQPAFARAFPSLFDGLAREHSRKPEEFYALVERFAPDARRADLFSRQRRRGFDGWGNELSKFPRPADLPLSSSTILEAAE